MNFAKFFKQITSFWFASVFVVLVACIFAVFFYRLRFGGGFSAVSSDWSNFGGYIGGVLGPLVSFVTLLAVLKTVYLQRELLDTQRDEFKMMQSLQRETFDSQQEEIKRGLDATRQEQYHRTLEHLLSMIDRHTAMYGGMSDRASQSIQTLANWSFEGRPVKKEQLISLAAMNEKYKAVQTGLMGLSIDLSQSSFDSIDELRKFYLGEMQSIFGSISFEDETDSDQ